MKEKNEVFEVNGHDLEMNMVWRASRSPANKYVLVQAAKEKMEQSRRYIMQRVEAGEVIYGVNTGFGAFSSVRISPEQIVDLQKNLIRSHSVGVGAPFSVEETRAMMLLRANTLARGHSGVRSLVAEKILEFLNHDIIPVIPQQGSVGASGDLAPLSHLALSLMGEGSAWKNGARVPTEEVLKDKKIQPLELQAKEGLSLINGCQVMTAVGLLRAYRARQCLWVADVAGAMSLEALKGSRKAFDPIIFEARGHDGEKRTARNLLKILGDSSEIAESHADCEKVQDAYSLRCMPAVHGSVKDTLRYGVGILEKESNASTDNPLVFADDNKILSCGNFHGMPVSHALDYMAISISTLSNISERRIAQLIHPAMSGLPAFLAPNGGLNSGHMIVQVVAAALVSENKIHAHPASVDSLPTSADKEDHVSMGTIAARKFGTIVENTERVLALELLSASQALDILKPLNPAPALQKIHQWLRTFVPFAKVDRVFANDVEAILERWENGELEQILRAAVGELEW